MPRKTKNELERALSIMEGRLSVADADLQLRNRDIKLRDERIEVLMRENRTLTDQATNARIELTSAQASIRVQKDLTIWVLDQWRRSQAASPSR